MTETRALVLATVLRVKDSHFIFPFCDVCYCKVTETRKLSRFECTKCKRSFNESQLSYRYRLSATISDGSAVCDVSIFGKCLQVIFGTEPAVLNRLLTRHSNSEETENEELLLKMMSDLIVGKQFYFGFKLPVKRNTVSSMPHSTLKYVLSHLRPQKNEKTAWKSAISDGIVAYQFLNPILTPSRQNLFHVLKCHFGEERKKMSPGNIKPGTDIQFVCQNEVPKLASQDKCALLKDSSCALNSGGITECVVETHKPVPMSQNKITETSEHTLNVLGKSSDFEYSTQFSFGMTSLELTCETNDADQSIQTAMMIREGYNPSDVLSQGSMTSHSMNSTCCPNKIANCQHEPNSSSGSTTTDPSLQEHRAAVCDKTCDKVTDVAAPSSSIIVRGNSPGKDRGLFPPVSKSINMCNLSNPVNNALDRSFSLTSSRCKQIKDTSTIDKQCKRSCESYSDKPAHTRIIPPPTSSTGPTTGSVDDDDHKSQAYFTGIYNHLEMLTASPTKPSLVPSHKLPLISTSKCNDSSTRVSRISKINSDHDSCCSTLQHIPSDLHSSRPQMCPRVESVITGLKDPKLDHSINGYTYPSSAPGSQHKGEICSHPLSREHSSPIGEEESNNSLLAADMPLSEDFELFLQQIEAQYAASEKGTEDKKNSCVKTVQDCSLKKPVACVKQGSWQHNQPVEKAADNTTHSSCNPGNETSHVKLLEKMPLDNYSNDSPVKDNQCDSVLLDSSAFSYSGSQELFSQSYIECKPVKDKAFPKNHSTPFTVINPNMPEVFNRNKFKSQESTVFNKSVPSTPLLFSQDLSSAISPLENCSKDNKDRLHLSKSCSKRMFRKHLKTKTAKLYKIQQASPYAPTCRGQTKQYWENSCTEKIDQERGSAFPMQVTDSTPDLFEEAIPDISDIVNSSKDGVSMFPCSQSWDVSHDLFSPSQNISEDLLHLKELTTDNEKMTLRKKLF